MYTIIYVAYITTQIYRLTINYFFALFCTFLSYVIVCQYVNTLGCVKIYNYCAKITRV